MSPSISLDRLADFMHRFPLLLSTAHVLNASRIPFAIGGSGCLFLLGNDRVPDDVDIYLPNSEHDRADTLFGIQSYFYTSPQEHVRNSNPGGTHAIQLTSALCITMEGKSYDLSLTEDVLSQRLNVSYEGEDIWLYPPEDVLLIKALLQRGADVGKHDVEDIRAFQSLYKIRADYLDERVKRLHAHERVNHIFGML